MPREPGKYDDLCAELREKTQAPVCLLIVVNGNKGTGFSALMPDVAADYVPAILRDVANQIERERRGMSQHSG